MGCTAAIAGSARANRVWAVVLVALLCVSGVRAAELKPFTTDGCSRFPDGTAEQPDVWRHCCVAHDKDYWKGGSRAERRASDLRLKECVAQTGHPKVARVMLRGVRVGGSPYWPCSFRWGYGWPYLRGYKILTADEQRQVMEKM